jgi:hypothetical protein
LGDSNNLENKDQAALTHHSFKTLLFVIVPFLLNGLRTDAVLAPQSSLELAQFYSDFFRERDIQDTACLRTHVVVPNQAVVYWRGWRANRGTQLEIVRIIWGAEVPRV